MMSICVVVPCWHLYYDCNFDTISKLRLKGWFNSRPGYVTAKAAMNSDGIKVSCFMVPPCIYSSYHFYQTKRLTLTFYLRSFIYPYTAVGLKLQTNTEYDSASFYKYMKKCGRCWLKKCCKIKWNWDGLNLVKSDS